MNHIKIIEFIEENSELSARMIYTAKDLQLIRHVRRKETRRKLDKDSNF